MKFLQAFVTMRGERVNPDIRGRYYAFAVPRVPAIWAGKWELL